MRVENLQPGKYVVAVSGGVDSVVLLDLLRLYPGLSLVVAHYDHGIRADSEEDRRFVQRLAGRYGLPFVYDKGNLGRGASEAAARELRYKFLHRTREVADARAIMTAHHQDDVLETIIINLLRGTGRKGLSSLASGEDVVRPLLHQSKSDIIDYARRHGLEWREDSTNTDTEYLRNHIRHQLLPGWSPEAKEQLLAIGDRMRIINTEVDTLLEADLHPRLEREWFIAQPHNVAREVIAAWLRMHGIHEFDRDTLERLTVAGKVAHPGKAIDVVKGHQLHIEKDYLALKLRER